MNAISNESLKRLRELAQSDVESNWLVLEHGSIIVCARESILVVVGGREEWAAIAAELLDARARINSIGPADAEQVVR